MSNIEYEAKILNIDPSVIKQKLRQLKATKIGEYNFRRYVFDTIPVTPNRWVRLRSDGQNTTLTVKQIDSDSIDGTSEWETEVGDIDQALIILEKIGIKPRGYQENKRLEYRLHGVQVTIDLWPKLTPYVEIEGANKAEVVATARILGYSKQDLVAKNTADLYQEIGIDLKQVAELTFDEQSA